MLVRNPNYWATPGKLDKIVFTFFSDDSQLVPALQNKEVNVINPSTVNLSIVQNANQVPATTKATVPGLEFEHFDFNQADPYLAKLQVREAIAHGVNRQQLIQRTVGEISKGITPLGSRMYVPTQSAYKATKYAYSPSQSASLLKELGFKKGSDGYFQPNYGPQQGKDLTFTIQSTSGNTIRAQTEELFQQQMKAIGIKINIQNYDANTFFGTNLPSGTYQIAEFAWVSTPSVSGNQSIYCSYTDATRLRSELDPLGEHRRGQPDEDGCLGAEQSPRRPRTSTRPTPSCGRTWSPCRCTRSRSSSPGPATSRVSCPTRRASASPGTPKTGTWASRRAHLNAREGPCL